MDVYFQGEKQLFYKPEVVCFLLPGVAVQAMLWSLENILDGCRKS
jgi:hypothetical protein